MASIWMSARRQLQPAPHDGTNQPPIRLAHVALDGGGVPGYDAPDRKLGFLALAGGIVCAVAMAPRGPAFARGNADHVDGGGDGRKG